MTTTARNLADQERPSSKPLRTSLLRAILVGLGLVVVVGARWAATVDEAPPLVVGALFGVALVGVAWAGGLRPSAIRPEAVAIGLAGAAVLVGLAIGASRLAGLPLRVVPQTDFAWWALITILVASAEELILRGILFDAIGEAAGIGAAIVVTSLLFALIHVPLYGWHVVPLDFGVGNLPGRPAACLGQRRGPGPRSHRGRPCHLVDLGFRRRAGPCPD